MKVFCLSYLLLLTLLEILDNDDYMAEWLRRNHEYNKSEQVCKNIAVFVMFDALTW